MKRILVFAWAMLIAGQVNAQQRELNIIPEPVQAKWLNGEFILHKNTVIQADKALTGFAEQFARWINPSTGFTLSLGNASSNVIHLKLNPALKIEHSEGYKLEVSAQKVTIEAPAEAGIFYGLQTLRQLLPPVIESNKPVNQKWTIPAVQITDYPRFGWRGLMLDVSRHFFPKEFVKEYIDQMARFKFNILHWHLTDDQGWRIEIKAYPKLTEVGAWRVYRSGRWWTHEPPKKGESTPYGGFYTQDDIREIVAYAKERNINILPEVDVPGHSLAAITAYPHLSATGYLYHVNPGSKFYTIDDNTLNPADERVYGFMDTVFTEVASLFPFEYIHVGGDECTKVFWQKSAQVQDFMKKNKIKDEEGLQSYFIKRMETILKRKGKKLIGWDEILEGGLAEDATVMSWRGMSGGIESAKMGHKVVMTPADFAYLDLYQGDPAIEPDTYSMLRLKTSYNWNPVPDNVKPSLILGGQGNLWTESVPNGRHAEYMTWPRGLALAEVFWSPLKKNNWSKFQQKLPAQFERFDFAAINYATAAYDVLVTTHYDEEKNLLAKMDVDIDGLDIHYTLDNTNPDIFSSQYTTHAVKIPKGIHHLRVQTFKAGKAVGKLLIVPREELEKRAPKK